MKCPVCHEHAEIVSLTHRVGIHWCEKINGWMYTNYELWSTAPLGTGEKRVQNSRLDRRASTKVVLAD